MSLSRRTQSLLLLTAILILASPAVRADLVLNVSVDTSAMTADYTGPFGLDFELLGTNGNTVTITNFAFGGGMPGPGSAFLTGGVTGDLSSTVSLADSSNFFNDFNQQFTPGSILTFTIDTTLVAPPPGGSADNFSMVLFSGYDPVNGYNPGMGTGGTPIPTIDPLGSDTFLNFNIDGSGATVVNSYPSASGDISITVTPAGAVPEPSSGFLMLLGVLAAATTMHRRRDDRRRPK